MEISQEFIEKNPSQIKKRIKTISNVTGNKITLWWHKNKEVFPLVSSIIEEINKKENGKKYSIYLLARYWFLLPTKQIIDTLINRFPNITFKPSSIHASKGLEADYVIGFGLESGRYGFPATLEDIPILDIVLAKQEEFENAEERRLFYVLMTRAKNEVHLIASALNCSPFAIELERMKSVINEYGQTPRYCPKCKTGALIQRKSGIKNFFGCSHYPVCTHTEEIRMCLKCLKGVLQSSTDRKIYICDQCKASEKACPICEGILIIRINKAKKNQFFGCSNFKNGCLYTS